MRRRAMRRLGALLAVAVGAATAGLTWWRHRTAARREHVDLYFGDGSMVSFSEASSEGGRLLALARRVVSVAGE
jgi:hypothetical protein